jgi:dihydroorotase
MEERRPLLSSFFVPMSALLLSGGRVVDPSQGLDDIVDVLLADGVIARIGNANAGLPPSTAVLDVAGLIVCPGFIDLHTHLRYPGFPEKETIDSGTAAAAAGGFTTVCAMANTDPVVDDVAVLEMVYAEAARSARVRVRQLAAVSRGLLGRELTDMRSLAAAGAIAFSDDGKPVADPQLMERALRDSSACGLPISVHEEDPLVVRGGVANAGEAAARLGLAPWPCAGEATLVARDIGSLAQVGGRLHIAHVSCADTIILLRDASERGLPVTAEVTPHHLRLTDRLLEGDPAAGLPAAHPCTKVNPPLRSPADVDAMIEALASGLIGAIATDHAPHTAADKAQPFAQAAFGFSAIETALPLLLDLVRTGRLPLSVLIERLTAGPARIFNLPGGTLVAGSPADICVFDPDEPWTVTPEALLSRGKNTPVAGMELRGRVSYTFVAGEIVHRAG